MKPAMTFVICLVLAFAVDSVEGQKVLKESIRSKERDRTYYLFVPDNIDKATPAPLIVLLHGSGRNGLSLIDKWKDLAKKDGIILVAPNSLNSQNWTVPQDAPDPLHDLIEELKTKHPTDPRRIYLFGHSSGAVVGLYIALLQSEYFAAATVHAGSLQPSERQYVERAKRKIPISIFVGTNDQFFPLSSVRDTRDLLNDHGFNSQLTKLKNHTHDYYGRADEINDLAWKFLKLHELSFDPKYEQYKWEK